MREVGLHLDHRRVRHFCKQPVERPAGHGCVDKADKIEIRQIPRRNNWFFAQGVPGWGNEAKGNGSAFNDVNFVCVLSRDAKSDLALA